MENILAPHRERTLRRMRTHDTVLCIQDGTRLNFTRRSQTEGLGVIGSNQTGAVARGLDLHTTLAVNPDGVALGILRAAFDAPELTNPEEKGRRKPREERKSFRWVEGLRDCAEAAGRLGEETRVVCTMDREADFLDLFIERRAHAPQVELLVRAKSTVSSARRDCRRAHGLAPSVRRGAQRAGPRRRQGRGAAAERAGEGQQTGPQDGRADRVAELTLRYQGVALPCPGAKPFELFVVHAREEQPPPGVEPLEWFVLTTLRVTSPDDATRILGWYALRWRIEEYFRVLKSGCKVEELQHHTAESLGDLAEQHPGPNRHAEEPRQSPSELTFPVYRPSGMTTTRCPDPGETGAIEALNSAYELTKNEETPQYRDGRCTVRDTWDEAVAQALGIDVETIFEYAELLAKEPAVSPTSWTRTLTDGNTHS